MFQGDIQGNPGLEAKAGGSSGKFWVPDDTCGPNPAKKDEEQLAEAAVEENARKKKPKKSRYELERYASKIVKMGGDGKEEFFQHLGRRMREAGDTCLSTLAAVAPPSTHNSSKAACYCRNRSTPGYC